MTLYSAHHYTKIIHTYIAVDPDGSCMGLQGGGGSNLASSPNTVLDGEKLLTPYDPVEAMRTD